MTETTDQAELRDRIAAAVQTVPIKYGSDTIEPVSTEEAHVLADVVVADLLGPIPADIDTATWTAIRAIQFMNEAEQRAEAHRLALSTALRLNASANWEALRDRAQDVVAETGDLDQRVRRLGLMVDEYGQGASALTNKLRRVRDRHRETCILARGEVKPTAFECGMCKILDAPAAPVSDAQVAVQLDPLEVRARAVREQQRAQHRAEVLREAAEICDEAGAVYASKELNDQADAAYRLMERFLRLADEAEYVAAPCSAGGCEPGGEPCTRHERLMAHAEGDHELCGPDCAPASGPGRVAGETQQPDTRKACTCSHPADEHSVYGCADDCGCEWMPKRLPPMDPVHILGINADELPAAVSQPETEA